MPSEWDEKEQWRIPVHIDLDEELTKLRSARSAMLRAAPAGAAPGATGSAATGAKAVSGSKAPRKIKLKGIALPGAPNAAAAAVAAAAAPTVTSAAVEKAPTTTLAAPVSMETDEAVKPEPTPAAQADAVKAEVKAEVKEESAAASSPMELC